MRDLQKQESGTQAASYKIVSAIAGIFFIAAGVMLVMHHRDSVNNALDTGRCLTNDGFKGFFEMLKHFLRQAYRWIFKACG